MTWCNLKNGTCQVCGNYWPVDDTTLVKCGAPQIQSLSLPPIDTTTKKSAVWVYWKHAADADEIVYSIKLARKNLIDLENIIVCGDRPKGIEIDHYIPQPRVSLIECKRTLGTQRWAKWVDHYLKIQAIIGDPQVTDDFLWLYDETFVVRRTSIAEIGRPRFKGHLTLKPQTKIWRQCKQKTAVLLNDRGYPIRNYSTHIPIVYNKAKMRVTFETFELYGKPLLIESIYQNHHVQNPVRDNGFLQYTCRPKPDFAINKGTTILNVGKFTSSVAAVLDGLLDQEQPKTRKSLLRPVQRNLKPRRGPMGCCGGKA